MLVGVLLLVILRYVLACVICECLYDNVDVIRELCSDTTHADFCSFAPHPISSCSPSHRSTWELKRIKP